MAVTSELPSSISKEIAEELLLGMKVDTLPFQMRKIDQHWVADNRWEDTYWAIIEVKHPDEGWTSYLAFEFIEGKTEMQQRDELDDYKDEVPVHRVAPVPVTVMKWVSAD